MSGIESDRIQLYPHPALKFLLGKLGVGVGGPGTNTDSSSGIIFTESQTTSPNVFPVLWPCTLLLIVAI